MKIQPLIGQDELLALTGHDAVTIEGWIAAGKLRAYVRDDGTTGYDRSEALVVALAWERACQVPLLLQLATWINSAVKRKQTADRNHINWLERAQEWTTKEVVYQTELEQLYEQLDDLQAGEAIPETLASLQRELDATMNARHQMEQAYVHEHALNQTQKEALAQAEGVFNDLKQEVARLTQHAAGVTRDVEHWQKRARTAEVECEQWRYRQMSWTPPVAPFPPIDDGSPRWRAAFFGCVGMMILLCVLLFLDSGSGVITRDAQDVKVFMRASAGSSCDRTTTFNTQSSPEQILNLYHRNLTLRGWWRTSQLMQPGIAAQATYYRWWDRAHGGQSLEVIVPSTDITGRSNVVVTACQRPRDISHAGQM